MSSAFSPINAADARTIATQRAESLKGVVVMKATKAIKAAMEQGQFTITVDIESITLLQHQRDMKAHFEDLGYLVSIDTINMTMTISW